MAVVITITVSAFATFVVIVGVAITIHIDYNFECQHGKFAIQLSLDLDKCALNYVATHAGIVIDDNIGGAATSDVDGESCVCHRNYLAFQFDAALFSAAYMYACRQKQAVLATPRTLTSSPVINSAAATEFPSPLPRRVMSVEAST